MASTVSAVAARATLISWLLVGVAACTPLRSEFTGFDALGPDDVAVVGKVVLDPPLGPAEQTEYALAAYPIKNIFYLDVGAGVHELETEASMGLAANSIQAHIGQTFRVIVPKTDRYYAGGYIMMRQVPPVEISAFPLGAEMPLEPGDRAAYIGTVLYHRDRFNKCVSIEIIDDYENEAAEFASLYGASPKLERRILREVEGASTTAHAATEAPSPCH